MHHGASAHVHAETGSIDDAQRRTGHASRSTAMGYAQSNEQRVAHQHVGLAAAGATKRTPTASTRRTIRR